MPKNNVKGALDDWEFDILPTQNSQKPESQNAGKSVLITNPGSKKADKSGNQGVKLSTSSKDDKPESRKADKPESQNAGKSGLVSNIQNQEVGKSGSKEVESSESQFNEIQPTAKEVQSEVLKSKTFDLSPALIRRIKIEAATTSKKEYQIALEAFEKYFNESF